MKTEGQKFTVVLELDVRDGTDPRKWDWDNLIDTSGTEVIVEKLTVYHGIESELAKEVAR